VDAKRLEELFVQKEAAVSRQNSRRGSGLLGAAGPDVPVPASGRAVSLLDPKRATNVGILITQLKRPSRRRAAQGPSFAALLGRSSQFEEIPAEELRDAILEANTSAGPFASEPDPAASVGKEQMAAEEAEQARRVTLANQVLEIMPTQEEREKLLAFDGDEADLSKPDRYLRMLAGIPRLEQRMKCILFKLRFDDELMAACEELRNLRDAVSAAIGCEALHALLQAILEVGNELNAGTAKGGACGFRLSSLPRFVELRSSKDPKLTLLHYVVETVLDNGADFLLDVRGELVSVEVACKVVLSDLQKHYREWTDSLDRVDREIVTGEQSRAELPDEGRYCESLTFFYNQASEALEEFKMSLEELEELSRSLANLFGEDPVEMEPHNILATLNMFLKRVEKVADEVRRRAEANGGKAPHSLAKRRPTNGQSRYNGAHGSPAARSTPRSATRGRGAQPRSAQPQNIVSVIDRAGRT